MWLTYPLPSPRAYVVILCFTHSQSIITLYPVPEHMWSIYPLPIHRAYVVILCFTHSQSIITLYPVPEHMWSICPLPIHRAYVVDLPFTHSQSICGHYFPEHNYVVPLPISRAYVQVVGLPVPEQVQLPHLLPSGGPTLYPWCMKIPPFTCGAQRRSHPLSVVHEGGLTLCLVPVHDGGLTLYLWCMKEVPPFTHSA